MAPGLVLCRAFRVPTIRLSVLVSVIAIRTNTYGNSLLLEVVGGSLETPGVLNQ